MLFDCGASDYFGNGDGGVRFADGGFVDAHHVQRVYIPRSDGRYYAGLRTLEKGKYPLRCG